MNHLSQGQLVLAQDLPEFQISLLIETIEEGTVIDQEEIPQIDQGINEDHYYTIRLNLVEIIYCCLYYLCL